MQNGTSLLELLIYLLCTVLISTLGGHLALSYMLEARQRTARVDAWVQLALALDRVHDDLKLAPADSLLWKKRTAEVLIFRLGQKDCGWYCQRGRIVRITGIYDKNENHWSERASSVILDAAESLRFRCKHRDDKLSGVKVSITKKCGKRLLHLDCFTAIKEKSHE